MILNENQIIRISKGPQFKTKGGPALAMIFLSLLILSIYTVVYSKLFYALIFLIISVFIFNIVLDIRGIEVETSLHRIREYKKILWLRIGKWESINNYKSIYLRQENVIVPTSEYSNHSSDTYHYYNIKLVDEMNKKEIFLAEFKNYHKAQNISKTIADATGLEFKDFLKRNYKNFL